MPIAMGELFTHPLEWKPLIVNQLIDFIRVHISDIGGITPALKLARLCEAYGVRTAFHGPGDVSPVGHAANVHLDLHVHNFGIQEFSGFNDALEEVFPGCPQLEAGLSVSQCQARAGHRYQRKEGQPNIRFTRTCRSLQRRGRIGPSRAARMARWAGRNIRSSDADGRV